MPYLCGFCSLNATYTFISATYPYTKCHISLHKYHKPLFLVIVRGVPGLYK